MARSMSENDGLVWVMREQAQALVRAERWEQAEAVVRSIPEGDEQVKALSGLLQALIEAKRWEQAERVAHSIPGSEQVKALSELGIALIENQHDKNIEGLCFRAEKMACTMPENDGSVWALKELARTLIQAERWEQAEEVARSIPESD